MMEWAHEPPRPGRCEHCLAALRAPRARPLAAPQRGLLALLLSALRSTGYWLASVVGS